jgi:hypothetical protein
MFQRKSAVAKGVDLDARGKLRQHRADHRVGAKAIQRVAQPRQPVGAHHLVVVEKGQLAAARLGDAGVARMRDAGPGFVHVADRDRARPRHPLDNGGCRPLGVVVDHQDLERRARRLLRQHAGDRPFEVGRPAVGEDDDCGLDHRP